MWWRVLSVLSLAGCAQMLGLEETSSSAPDARRADAPGKVPDAQLPCLGGDARGVDPATGACYVYFASPMTRDAARTACRGIGATARLASIQSASESSLITSLIGTTDALIGGYDEVTEGVFVWDDGTPVQLTNWNAGEPNNGAAMFEEDCIVVIGSRGGVWNDVPCAPPPLNLGSYPFVCERD
jgi:hypothetical protein